MSFPLIVRPAAEADIATAQQWYSAQRPGLGDEFLDALEAALYRISQNPEIHAAGYR